MNFFNFLAQNNIYISQNNQENFSLFADDSFLNKNKIDLNSIAQKIAKEFSLKYNDLDFIEPAINKFNKENYQLINEYKTFPFSLINNRLSVAVCFPENLDNLKKFKIYGAKEIDIFITPVDILLQKINLLKQNHSKYKHIETVKKQNKSKDITILLDEIINKAITQKASDIHIEPFEKIIKIRFRIDGALYLYKKLDITDLARLLTRIKILANLDIANKRIPQDGKIIFDYQNVDKKKKTLTKKLDFRVATMPTMWGEKAVLRILDTSSLVFSLTKLGMDKYQEDLIKRAITKNQGLVLVTGPTGSGKTFSLYAALKYLNSEEKNICTVEDPIEINIENINQVAIKKDIGLDFSKVLRAFLRQDPDVIMLGEIRDKETAQIAIKASQTGHLVLSTLHTKSAIDTISRLLNMQIENYLITSSISLIIAQRLIRLLCPFCKEKVAIKNNQFIMFKKYKLKVSPSKIIYKAKGCIKCTAGYKGRIGVFEILPISKKTQNIILKESKSTNLEESLRNINFKTLEQNSLSKVLSGICSFDEAIKVIL